MKELKYLNKYIKKYRGRLFLGMFITVVAAVFKLVVPMKVGDSVTIVEKKINGEITDMSIVQSELLTNIFIAYKKTISPSQERRLKIST